MMVVWPSSRLGQGSRILPRRSDRCYRLSIRSHSGCRRCRRNGIRRVGEACGQRDGSGGDHGGNSIGSSGG